MDANLEASDFELQIKNLDTNENYTLHIPRSHREQEGRCKSALAKVKFVRN